MLHEYRDELSVLKQENTHLAKFFNEHNELNQENKNIREGYKNNIDTQ